MLKRYMDLIRAMLNRDRDSCTMCKAIFRAVLDWYRDAFRVMLNRFIYTCIHITGTCTGLCSTGI